MLIPLILLEFEFPYSVYYSIWLPTHMFTSSYLFRRGIELDDIAVNKGSQEAEYEDLDVYRGDYSQNIATYDDVHFPPSPPATLPPRVSSTSSPPAEYEYVQQPITKDSGRVKEFDYTHCAAYATTSRQEQTERSDKYANVNVLSADLESSLQDEDFV